MRFWTSSRWTPSGSTRRFFDDRVGGERAAGSYLERPRAECGWSNLELRCADAVRRDRDGLGTNVQEVVPVGGLQIQDDVLGACLVVIDGQLDRKLVAPGRRIGQVGLHEERLESAKLSLADPETFVFRDRDRAKHPGRDIVGDGDRLAGFTAGIGGQVGPEPGLREELPHALDLGQRRRRGVGSRLGDSPGGRVAGLRGRGRQRPRRPGGERDGDLGRLGELLTGRHLAVAEDDDARVGEDVARALGSGRRGGGGPDDLGSSNCPHRGRPVLGHPATRRDSDRRDTDGPGQWLGRVQLGLRLEEKPLQLVKDLLQVQPILRQDVHRLVDRHQTDPSRPLGLHVDVQLVARFRLGLAGRHRHLLRIVAGDGHRKVVRRDLGVRQDLVHQQPKLRRHQRGQGEGEGVGGREVREDHAGRRQDLIVEVLCLAGRDDLELGRVANLQRGAPNLLDLDKAASRRVAGRGLQGDAPGNGRGCVDAQACRAGRRGDRKRGGAVLGRHRVGFLTKDGQVLVEVGEVVLDRSIDRLLIRRLQDRQRRERQTRLEAVGLRDDLEGHRGAGDVYQFGRGLIVSRLPALAP